MNLFDLFHAGGGTKDSAYMLDAEISRTIVGPDQTASIEHIRLKKMSLRLILPGLPDPSL